jgi:hypothetical protein
MRNLLFGIGLVISIAGFLVGQSTRIEMLLSVVSPAYANASAGRKQLVQSGTLLPGQRGFIELQAMILDILSTENSRSALSNITVARFVSTPNSIRMPGPGPNDDGGMAIDAHLSNGQTVAWSAGNADKRIVALKDRGVVLFSSIIFIFGVVVQLVSRAVHDPKQKQPESD